jgi:hypothetical protein
MSKPDAPTDLWAVLLEEMVENAARQMRYPELHQPDRVYLEIDGLDLSDGVRIGTILVDRDGEPS